MPDAFSSSASPDPFRGEIRGTGPDTERPYEFLFPAGFNGPTNARVAGLARCLLEVGQPKVRAKDLVLDVLCGDPMGNQ
jgi:hypothetical protein